jgi:DinB superfamily
MDQIREQIAKQLHSQEAHAGFDKAVEGLAPELRGKKPKGVPHSAWELLEHIRIAQSDILEFTRNPKHKSPKWPAGYWPTSPEPLEEGAWDRSIAQVKVDRKALHDLVLDSRNDLTAKIPGGSGQTLLREALLAADHLAYHVGELVFLRKILGAWH